MRCIANRVIQFLTNLLNNCILWICIATVLGVFLGYSLTLSQIRNLLNPLTTIVSLLLAALGIWITLLKPQLDIMSNSSLKDYEKNASALLYLKFFGVSTVLLIITILLLYLTWGIVPCYLRISGNSTPLIRKIVKSIICIVITGIYMSLVYISLSLMLPVLRVYVFHSYNERKKKLTS